MTTNKQLQEKQKKIQEIVSTLEAMHKTFIANSIITSLLRDGAILSEILYTQDVDYDKVSEFYKERSDLSTAKVSDFFDLAKKLLTACGLTSFEVTHILVSLNLFGEQHYEE